MADAPQLDRPSVEIIQEFTATTPTILRPSLQACMVGPCMQVVEAVLDDGSLNSEAIIGTPARLVTEYLDGAYDIGGKTLSLSVNRGAPRVLTVPTDKTPEQLADLLREANIAGLSVRTEALADTKRVVLETTTKGDNAAITVGLQTSSEVLLALGWRAGFTVAGASGYDNAHALHLTVTDYPDPRSNKQDLVIDYDSVRVFLATGGPSPIEVSRTGSILRGASGVDAGLALTVQDDGDNDPLSPYVVCAGQDFSAPAAPARLAGTVPFGMIDFTAAVQGKVLRMSLDGEGYQSLTVPTGVTTGEGLVSAINDLWGAGVASVDEDSGVLVITSPAEYGGIESSVAVDKQASSSALLTALGLTGSNQPLARVSAVYGAPYPPQIGDELWVDGLRVGTVVEVPAGAGGVLRLDGEQLLNFSGRHWILVARNLRGAATLTRPSAELLVSNDGTLRIKAGLLRTLGGAAQTTRGLGLYVGYDALRLDVTPRKKAGDFNLVRVGTLTELADKLAPVDPQNPLATAMYFALLNAPGLEVTGIGVDEINEAAPSGTVDAYARTLEFLESKDVYSVVPLTHDQDVGQLAALHVKAMSAPANGLERIAILNAARPSRKSDTLVVSGSRANVGAVPTSVVDTGVANLQALLGVVGKPGPTYTEDDGVFIVFEGSNNHYLIESVSGAAVTLNNGPLTKNDDAFYVDGDGSDLFESLIVDRPFSVALRGTPLSNRTDEAAAYGDIGRTYKSNRVIVTMPDTVVASMDGLAQALPGYYAAAAIAGRKAAKSPSLPMTEEALVGFSGLVGSQDRYSEPQLRMIAGGGVWILYQDGDGQPIRTRHQLTTDVSSLLTRESSILDALDFAAKTLRVTFRNFVGRFNITTGLLEALNLVCDGVRSYLLDNQVFAEFDVVELLQDSEKLDQVSAVTDVTTLKPLNKLRITMRIT